MEQGLEWWRDHFGRRGLRVIRTKKKEYAHATPRGEHQTMTQTDTISKGVHVSWFMFTAEGGSETDVNSIC